MPKGRLSWKWKLVIAFVVLFLVGTGFVFSEYGYHQIRNGIVNRMQDLPEADRRESEYANTFMSFAWFRGNICLDEESAMEMYKEFCGYQYPAGQQTGSEYLSAALRSGKVKGLCSENGAIGWGPEHPRAPEAFYELLQLKERKLTGAMWKQEASNYYRLFFTWMKFYSKEHKPHPMFMKYWPKIRDKGDSGDLRKYSWLSDIDKTATGAEPYKEEETK